MTVRQRPVLLRCQRSAGTSRVRQQEAARLQSLGLRVLDTDLAEPSLAGVSALVVHSGVLLTDTLLQTAKQLDLIVTTTSGYDHIDVAAARRRGIRVVRCPLARRDAVVETSLAMALSFLRDLPGLNELAKQGVWARSFLDQRPIGIIADLVVGIIGHGVIGKRAAEVWSSLGASVLVSDPLLRESPDARELAGSCSLISLHCSLTASSRALVDRQFLAAMQPGAILINTARGECVDMDALGRAQHLAGIGLDVFAHEPWPDLADWARRPGVLVTPHAAGYYPGLEAALSAELLAAIETWREGGRLPYEVCG